MVARAFAAPRSWKEGDRTAGGLDGLDIRWAEGQNAKWKENRVKMPRALYSSWRHRHKLAAACFFEAMYKQHSDV